MKQFKNVILILAVFWTAFIVYGLTSEPSGTTRFPWLAIDGVDKLIHAVLFAVESILITLVLQRFNLPKPVVLNLLWCLVLGGGLELIQYLYVNGRYGDVWDLVADMIGAVVGYVFLRTISKNKEAFMERNT